MKGILVFDQLNDVVYVRSDKKFRKHITNLCLKEGLLPSEENEETEETPLNNNALMQLFSPLVTSQRIMLSQFSNPYNEVQSQDGTIMVFAESLGFLFIAIGNAKLESSTVVQRRLQVFMRLMKMLCGPVYSIIKQSFPGGSERQNLFDKLLNTWEEFHKEELSFAIEAVERLLVNQYLSGTCVHLLEGVLEKMRNSHLELTASHAFLLVNTKLLALFSSRNASELTTADILLLTILAHAHHPNSRFELPRSPRPQSRSPSPSPFIRQPSPSIEALTLNSESSFVPIQENKHHVVEQLVEPTEPPLILEDTLLAALETKSSQFLQVPFRHENDESSDSEAFYSPCGSPARSTETLIVPQQNSDSTPTEVEELLKSTDTSVLSTGPKELGDSTEDPWPDDAFFTDFTEDHIFLQTNNCMMTPHVTYTVKVMDGVILVIVCDSGKSLIAGGIVQMLEILHTSQINKQPSQAKSVIELLDCSMRRITDGTKKLKTIVSQDGERFIRLLHGKWDTVKKNGLHEFLKNTSNRFMTSKLETSVSTLMETLKDMFERLCLNNSRMSVCIPLSLEVTDTLVDAQAFVRYSLADYIDYLKVKALRNITITSYINEFPGLVHFIYVNRTNNYITVPSPEDPKTIQMKNVNIGKIVKEKVHEMIEFTRIQLQLGHFAAKWRDSSFSYSYYLWFEDLKGNPLKPQALLYGLKNFPCPGVLCGDFYKHLIKECFPSLSADQVQCYELLCMHLSSVPPPTVVDHVKRLAAMVWDLADTVRNPIDLFC